MAATRPGIEPQKYAALARISNQLSAAAADPGMSAIDYFEEHGLPR